MTLLKRFMGWDIGSIRIAKNNSRRVVSSPQFRSLSWQLLLSYVGGMATVMLLSTIAEYQFVAYNLDRELDRQLAVLANAASHSLSAIEADPGNIKNRLPESVDNDGDLDLPWQDLREQDQTVEWFDVDGRRLQSMGKQVPLIPLIRQFYPVEQNGLRMLTIPVYRADSPQSDLRLRGYVRVSKTTEDIEHELHRLLAGLAVGDAIALILIGVTGWRWTQRSLQPIQRSMQQLQQFTADASHELRNPLTAIRTTVEAIQIHPERIHPADVEKLGAIASATDQMSKLVEDLLLLARSDANSLAPAIRGIPIPIDEILEDLVEFFGLEADAKNITLQTNWTGEVWVWGDAIQLRRLFTNLIENGLQYTPNGGKVKVSIEKSDTLVTILVEDTGIGIPAEQLSFVFDRFWRADRARSWREGGSGLGLAIARAIARAHGGDISVTSQVNVGTCFRICLPAISDRNL